MFESILARDGEERAATEHLRDGLARASDPHRFRDYYDTAAVKLGDAQARHLLSATLPTAIHTAATGQRGWDAAVAGVRDVLARGADRNVVIDLLGDPDLHTARNVPVATLARLKTVEVPENGSTLPVLPPDHPGADTELRAFAENTVAAIVDPRGADTQWVTDLDYTHPQQQAYRNAMHALATPTHSTRCDARSRRPLQSTSPTATGRISPAGSPTSPPASTAPTSAAVTPFSRTPPAPRRPRCSTAAASPTPSSRSTPTSYATTSTSLRFETATRPPVLPTWRLSDATSPPTAGSTPGSSST